jgi:hypothetical protein
MELRKTTQHDDLSFDSDADAVDLIQAPLLYLFDRYRTLIPINTV